MKLYRFSPVETHEQFEAALQYIAEASSDLALLLCGNRLPAPILKIFAHYPLEYDAIKNFVNRHGKKSKLSSNTSFYVKVDDGHSIANIKLRAVGVRQADPYRMQVGCGDYLVKDFQSLAKRLSLEQPDFVGTIYSEHNIPMLELWHPDFDVLGYVIPANNQTPGTLIT